MTLDFLKQSSSKSTIVEMRDPEGELCKDVIRKNSRIIDFWFSRVNGVTSVCPGS